MKRALLAALAVAPALAAAQQPPRHERAWQNLRSAVIGMRDGVGIGETVMDELEGRGVAVVVDRSAPVSGAVQQVLVGTTTRTRIAFGEDLADRSPRYISVLVAERAAGLLLADMPGSAEKDYLTASYMTRSWLELGGDRRALPSFDGYRDDARARILEEWHQSDMTGRVRDARAAGRPTLAAQLEALQAGRDRLARELCICDQAVISAGGCAYGERAAMRDQRETADRLAAAERELAVLRRQSERATRFHEAEKTWMFTNQHLMRQ